jgi:TetR/AcrR family transcriptional regulator
MVRHAIASEDKEARREAILEAAGALFMSGDGSLPAAAQIATAAGLAKGTVYLYFRTKEEIFVALLLDACLRLLGEIESVFKGATGTSGGKVAMFLTVYVHHLARYPEMLRLDAMCSSVLEKNLDLAKLREFKFAFVARLTETGSAVEVALRLPPGRGNTLLMRSFALTRGLWQSSHPGGEPASMTAEPALAPLCPDFDKELMEALTEYWRGALAGP